MLFIDKLKTFSTAFTLVLGGLIAPAFAASQTSTFMTNLLPIGVIFIAFYIFLIRPQRKKTEAHKQLVASLKEGNYVMLNSGIIGRVVTLDGEFAQIAVYNDTFLVVSRHAIMTINDKFAVADTLKPFKKTKKTKGKAVKKEVTKVASEKGA